MNQLDILPAHVYEPTVFVQSCAQFPFIMEHSLKSQGIKMLVNILVLKYYDLDFLPLHLKPSTFNR